MNRKASLSILPVIMLITLPGCGDFDLTFPPEGPSTWCQEPNSCNFAYARFDVEPREGILAVGDTLRIRATYHDPDGVVRDTLILWTSEPFGMADVDAAGLVTARRAGQVWIKAAVAPSESGQTGPIAYSHLHIVERQSP